MKTFVQKFFGLTGFFLLATAASAQDFAIDQFNFVSGTGTSSGGVFAVSGTITQPNADLMSGGAFSLTGEFLSLRAAVLPVVPPVGVATNIFDNTGGSDNGGIGATATTWLAGKFCLGSQPYGLDSVSLLLSNGGFPAQGANTVRLQIYANDPGGKPSVSTGLIMNLADLTNPITISTRLVKWTPATPFSLSANTCYWAVLSVESGVILGQIVSFTMPTGVAGAFGGTSSRDAGATWGTPDKFSNFKMLIQGIALGTPSPTPELAADGSTAIPGGTGNFTSLPLAPSLSGNNLVFYGAGSGGQQGIYLATRGGLTAPSRIADLATPIPGGTGNFLSFGTEAGIIIVSGKNAVFAGTGAGGQRGIYGTTVGAVGPPFRIADTATAIPGGTGNFTEFPNGRSVSGDNVVFAGTGAGGQQGIYGATIGIVGPPYKIADTATAIPAGTGNFTTFPAAPSISGDTVAFLGNGSSGQQGIYARVGAVAPPFRIADTATAIPAGTGNFSSFGSEAGIIIVSGKNAVFAGKGTGGQQGIYGARILAPALRAAAPHGTGEQPAINDASASIDGAPFKIADTATAIPGGTGNFTGFGEASVSESEVAFLGMGANGQTGIYELSDGQLRKVISVGEAIKGRTITGLDFSRDALSEDGAVAFQATFSDGSQGVYTIDVPPPPAELRITAAERIGNDLRLSFTSVVGQNYAIQSRADLVSGTWATLAGTEVSGTGETVRITLANPSTESQRFYRVQVLP